MSRALKFRAWNIKLREWNKDLKILLNGTIKDFDWDDEGYYEFKVLKEEYVVEQYTGLKDKNGIEIYEGDIVKIETYSRVFQVVYRKWDCSFVYENDEDEEIVHMFSGFSSAYEIIGNIHENPELIGGEE